METPTGHDRKGLVCFNEFLGQIFFMYIVLVSGAGSDTWGIAGPLALFAVVNVFGGVSGGHFNPAVTLGVFVREAKWAHNFIFTLMIIASQITGALVGMLVAYIALRIKQDGEYTVLDDQVGLLIPSTITKDDLHNGQVTLGQNFSTFYMEVICTFVFVLFILFVTGKHTMVPDLGVMGVPAICLVLWALCQVDSFTGASFNPALAIGSTFFQTWCFSVNPQGVMTHYLLEYLAGASLGGILAGCFYNCYERLFKKHEHDIHSQINHEYGTKSHSSD